MKMHLKENYSLGILIETGKKNVVDSKTQTATLASSAFTGSREDFKKETRFLKKSFSSKGTEYATAMKRPSADLLIAILT